MIVTVVIICSAAGAVLSAAGVTVLAHTNLRITVITAAVIAAIGLGSAAQVGPGHGVMVAITVVDLTDFVTTPASDPITTIASCGRRPLHPG